MLIIKLAFRNILRNRRRTILTLLSMAGGYWLLSLTLSLDKGSYDDLINQFTRNGVGHVQIVPPGYLDRPKQTNYINFGNKFEIFDIDAIRNDFPELVLSTRIESFALVYGQNKSMPSPLLGIDPKHEPSISRLKANILEGHWLGSGTDKREVLVGVQLAKKLKIKIGDEIPLIGQGVDGSMANDLFKVIGIVGPVDGRYSHHVILSSRNIRAFLSMSNSAHRIILLAPNYDQALDVQGKIRGWLTNKGLHEKLMVKSWQQVESEFKNSMDADRKGNQVSIFIILFLVALGVLNTLLMSTLERTGEFGVLKAIGTTPSHIFGLIMTESFLMVTIAIAVGLTLAIPTNSYFTLVGIPLPEPMDMAGATFSHMLGSLHFSVFLFPAIYLLVATFLVALIPAIKMSTVKPIEAMARL